MKKTVILAEKPSVGKDIARVLKCTEKRNGFYEGKDAIVTWALGHLVTLADPEEYDKAYQVWDLEQLPMIPTPLKTNVIKQTGKQFQIVKSQLHRQDVDSIVIATDAGREGELVARWIIEKAKVHKPIKRLWISSVTDKAINEGFRNLKDGKQYEALGNSAKARAEADWYVGINATRALTSKYNAQLSCGRVQTPTLAMISAREQQISQFKPVPFYGILIKTGKTNFQWTHKITKEMRSFQKSEVDLIIKDLKALPQNIKVVSVKSTPKKQYAPQLYDLTTLQSEANARFKWGAKETLSILQRLYEQYKIVTYPRTDSRYLSDDMVPTFKERLLAIRDSENQKLISEIIKSGIKVSKHFVDNGKVSDHHAIIPTEERVLLSSLTDKERKLYGMIVDRFISVLLPPFEYLETTVIAEMGKESFHAKGRVITSQGWKALSQSEDSDNETQLPVLKEGEVISVQSVNETNGETKPPSPFTEGTLLAAMENPTPFISEEDKKWKETLKDVGGIGTVATRADIIEKLLGTFLIEKRGHHLHTTSKGRQLLELSPKELTTPILTAKWEQELSQIAKGKLTKDVFMKEIIRYTQDIISNIKNSDQRYKHDNLSGTKCPTCGKLMLSVNHKKGKMLVCQDRECNTKKTIAQTTNARCPECKKKLELRGEGDAALFACVCGYREKRASFQDRRSKEKQTKASKQDVSKFLKHQNKQEEPLNNPFADMLGKLFDK